MKTLKIYQYPKCSTCQKALKFLDAKKIPYEKIDITTQAPSKPELKEMAAQLGSLKPLFNTSGLVYKEMGLSAKLGGMTESQQIDLLASNGRLVKRPFVAGMGLVGFKEEQWKAKLK